ncbi:MAG: ABC transporter permease, partial [Halothiobacillus sp.]|nr:ABC transporter permease [Halothiobacillus sp.]
MSEQAAQVTAPAQSLGPWRRVWQRFRRHRRGYVSLWLFSIL